MKDFAKKCLIATFFIVIGVIVVLQFTGDNSVFSDTVNKVKEKIKNFTENGFDGFEISEDMFWSENWQIYDVNEQDMFDEKYPVIRDVSSHTETASATGITKLDFKLGGCTLELVPSSDDEIRVDAQNVYAMQCYLEDGVYYVKAIRANTKLELEENPMSIKVQVPEGIAFEEILFSLGAGVLDVKTMKADTMNVSIGAGVFKTEKVVAENFACKVGAGQAVMKETTINKKAEFSVGAGEIVFEGSVPGDLSADCAMGKMEFAIYGSTEKDHNLDMNCAAGDLHVGSYSFEGLVNEQYVDNGAAHSYKLSCAMGSLTLEFKE